MKNLKEQVKKKHSATKTSFLGLQPRISKIFPDHYVEQFFLTVGQNNFGNKILLLRTLLG